MNHRTLGPVRQKGLCHLQASLVVGFALLGSRDGALGQVDALPFVVARGLPEQLVDGRRHVVRRGVVDTHDALVRRRCHTWGAA